MSARRFKRWVAAWFIGAIAVLFLIEEWLWNGLKRGMALLGKLPGLRRLERWIAGLPPAGAALLFVAPTTLILPIKLFALKMIMGGHLLQGTGVIVAAKLAATALFARVYVLTQPSVMQVQWFARLHAAVLRWRVWVYGQIESHPLWRALRRQMLQWRASMEAWRGRNTRWERRLKAARRLDRMRRRAAHPSAG
jgi:energy-coupling factor transporter transmembrane protein EcfT